MTRQKITFDFGSGSECGTLAFDSAEHFVEFMSQRSRSKVTPKGLFHNDLPDCPAEPARWPVYDAIRRIMTFARSGRSVLGSVELAGKNQDFPYVFATLEWFVIDPFEQSVHIRVRKSDENILESPPGWDLVKVGSALPAVVTFSDLYLPIKRDNLHTVAELWYAGLNRTISPQSSPAEYRLSKYMTIHADGNILRVVSPKGSIQILTPWGPIDMKRKTTNWPMGVTPKTLVQILRGESLTVLETETSEIVREIAYGPNPPKNATCEQTYSFYLRHLSRLLDRRLKEAGIKFTQKGHVRWLSLEKNIKLRK